MFFNSLTISVCFSCLYSFRTDCCDLVFYIIYFSSYYTCSLYATNLISLHIRYFKIGISYSLKMKFVIYVFVKFRNLARICLSVWTNSYRQTRTNPVDGRILCGVFYDLLNYLFLFGMKYFFGLYFENYIMQM